MRVRNLVVMVVALVATVGTALFTVSQPVAFLLNTFNGANLVETMGIINRTKIGRAHTLERTGLDANNGVNYTLHRLAGKR